MSARDIVAQAPAVVVGAGVGAGSVMGAIADNAAAYGVIAAVLFGICGLIFNALNYRLSRKARADNIKIAEMNLEAAKLKAETSEQ